MQHNIRSLHLACSGTVRSPPFFLKDWVSGSKGSRGSCETWGPVILPRFLHAGQLPEQAATERFVTQALWVIIKLTYGLGVYCKRYRAPWRSGLYYKCPGLSTGRKRVKCFIGHLFWPPIVSACGREVIEEMSRSDARGRRWKSE